MANLDLPTIVVEILDALNNTIGGAASGTRNVIWGNNDEGVEISLCGADTLRHAFGYLLQAALVVSGRMARRCGHDLCRARQRRAVGRARGPGPHESHVF